MEVQESKTTPRRLRILGEDEIEAIYGRPRFTHEERIEYFSLSQPEKALLLQLRSVKSQAYFVLQLGYFKAKHLFFIFDLHEVADDLQYVLEQHFDNKKITRLSAVDKDTRLKQQRLILERFNYRSCDEEERSRLEVKARQAAMVCGKPVKRHLRPILRTVNFTASLTGDPLIEAIHFLKTALGKGKPLGQYPPEAFPSRFIPDTIKRYLYAQDTDRQKKLLADRYEFLVYRLLRKSLEAGDIFCHDSVRFRSFEDDLLDEQRWQEKEKLMVDTILLG
jgi:hypothetical protein